jgi:protein SCO1/2
MKSHGRSLFVFTFAVGFGHLVACGCSPSINGAGTGREEALRTTISPAESSVSDCCKTETAIVPTNAPQAPKLEPVAHRLEVPDIVLMDQDGRPVNVYQDLAKDKLLVVNFIFTTCKGVCPPMGVNFGHLQRRLGNRLGRDVNLVSVTVDPVTDTPERLKAWGKQFDASPGWTLLTGSKRDVDRLLKALRVFTPDKSDHSPFILVGWATEGRWQRVHGLTPADKLSEIILGYLASSRAPTPEDMPPASRERGNEAGFVSATQRYFTDLLLVNQRGKTMRLYSDVLKGKVVVITPFFTSCRASCPQLIDTFAKLQSHYENHMGKDLYLIAITVDPETDTFDKLRTYADQVHAGPGWYFLTGENQNVDTALGKLGMRIKSREDHSNIFIIGKETTGLWKKAMGLAPPEEIINIVDSVLKDGKS